MKMQKIQVKVRPSKAQSLKVRVGRTNRVSTEHSYQAASQSSVLMIDSIAPKTA